ncbi:superoxide dismutase family protein [Nesterenkonia alkaliphila]|uniref:Superoxide dismutase copper/zinc binding domain-containing protein n=1 Tax=Nesterenkonia alkaliphila TaxID=1463631 RepID=A0A7K1UFQ8_9MICC|nr:superoxide dismutase family protein [Nesterenkonia alkaliphila]MVT25297.1 hypothetical protein [Nesterenkonia alkaliphila]GFZ81895.1 hypothetical protein GCM10011359_08070 [Nesterenkonia alkaliphila]
MSFTHRWPALTAATLSTALILTACGNGEDTNDDAASSPEPEQTAQATAPPAEGAQEEAEEDTETEPFASAELIDVAENDLGHVSFTELDEEEGPGVLVSIELWNLTPGFRAVSVHEHGLCEIQSENEWGQVGDFYSAGGHLQGEPATEDVIEGEELEEEELPENGGEQAPPDETAEEETWEGGGFSAGALAQQPPAEEDQEVPHPDRAGNFPNVLINQDGTGSIEFVTDRLSEELLLADGGRSVIVHSDPDHHGNIPSRYAPYGPDQESQATGDTGSRIACGVVSQ